MLIKQKTRELGAYFDRQTLAAITAISPGLITSRISDALAPYSSDELQQYWQRQTSDLLMKTDRSVIFTTITGAQMQMSKIVYR